MSLGILAASTLAVLAVASSATAAPVSFAAPPADVTAILAGNCMERGHKVTELTSSQVVCEIAMTRREKVDALFFNFRWRRYSEQVRHFAGFTVIPSSTGSMVQVREWQEAQLGLNTRTYEFDDVSDSEAVIRQLTDTPSPIPG